MNRLIRWLSSFSDDPWGSITLGIIMVSCSGSYYEQTLDHYIHIHIRGRYWLLYESCVPWELVRTQG